MSHFIGIVSTTLLLLFLMQRFIAGFKANISLFIPLFATVLLFAAGFTLRLSSDQSLIDLGFFCTEFSYLFTTVLFTSTLILGQAKYWKVT